MVTVVDVEHGIFVKEKAYYCNCVRLIYIKQAIINATLIQTLMSVFLSLLVSPEYINKLFLSILPLPTEKYAQQN